MAKASEPAVRVVLASFATDDDTYQKGEIIEADHPSVKRWPDMFGPVVFRHPMKRTEERVEQATAAPGEKRGA
jgi:hypothetical protein